MRRLSAYIGLILIAAVASAQQHPNQDRGFTPEKMFQVTDLDSVNMFNGNLVVTIPIGSPYHVNGPLTYAFTLVYNSNIWDFQSNVNGAVTALPNQSSNAGFGWQVSLGRIIPPYDPQNHAVPAYWIYESADGAHHVMYSTDGVNGLSRDNSFIRMRGSGSLVRYIDLPDGRVLTFGAIGGDTKNWRLMSIVDAFSNAVSVTYPTPPTAYADYWEVSDSLGRKQKLYFKDQVKQRILDRVELTSFGAVTATYQFDYATRTIDRPPQDSSGPGFAHGPPIAVAFLRKITMPSALGTATGATYQFQLPNASGNDPDPYYDTIGETTGMIRGMHLPTGGWVKWDYAKISYPAGSTPDKIRTSTYGVKERSLTAADATTVIGQWTYNHVKSQATTCDIPPPQCTKPDGCSSGAPRQMIGMVTGPPRTPGGSDRVTNLTYFSIYSAGSDNCLPIAPWTDGEYSLPITHYVDDGSGRLLSSEVRTGIDPASLGIQPFTGRIPSGQLVRSQYAKYESDSFTDQPPAWDTNRRIQSTRTEDVNCGSDSCTTIDYSTTDFYSYDGFGHYRQASMGGDFNDGKFRTTFTNYDGALDANGDWVLGTYTEQCVADESHLRTAAVTSCAVLPNASITKTQFERSTGFLTARRTLLGSSLQTKDLLAMFGHDSAGRPVDEKYYGGDSPAQALSTTNAFEPPATPEYEISTTNTAIGNIIQRRSRYAGLPSTVYSVDEDYDLNSGLLKVSRDSAGLATNYSYDALGRLVSIHPQVGGGAWSELEYIDAVGSTPAEVDLSRYVNSSSTVLLGRNRYFYDPLGRLTKEKRRMPDDSESTRVTNFNGLGWTMSGSEWEANDTPNNLTTYAGFDAFGRPTSITAPDAKVTTFEYTGMKTKKVTVNVATGNSNGTITETAATTTQTLDDKGNVLAVQEPTGGLTASYTYDHANRLTTVVTAAQTRAFAYDGRGFLTSEQHPESGTTSYDNFDSRGHARQKATPTTTLTYTYDAAERLSTVSQDGFNLKEFHYDRPNAGSDYSLGKLDYALRHNYQPAPIGDVVVKETYTYAGVGGRASSRKTEVNGQTYATSFGYDDLGDVTAVTYPQCSGCSGGAAGPARTVTNLYKYGYVREVPGYTSHTQLVSYFPNGMVSRLTHLQANHTEGPVWTQTLDASGMARPGNLSLTGACDSFAITSQPADVTATNGSQASIAVTAPGAITFQWYQVTGSSSMALSGQTSATLSITASVTTSYWVRVGNGLCTIDSRIATVTVPACASPNSTISGATPVSAGGSGAASVPALSGATYSWTITNGTLTSSTTGNSVTYVAACSGSVTLGVTVTASCGTSSSGSRSVPITAVTATVSGGGGIAYGGSAIISAALTGTPPWNLTWSDGLTQNGVMASPATRTVSPSQVVTYTVSSVSGAGCNGTSSGSATVVPAPTNVVASLAGGGSQITVNWSAVAGAASYKVQRSVDNQAYAQVGTTVGSTTTFSDNDPVIASGGVKAYVYQVLAVGGVLESLPSSRDVATHVIFTDDPATSGATLIKGILVKEAREAVDAVRFSAGLTKIWNGAELVGTPLYAWIFYEPAATTPLPRDLFNALNQARQALGLAPVTYGAGVPPPSANGPIMKQHLNAIREGVK